MEPARPVAPRAQEVDGELLSYVGEDRRKQNRRRGPLPTTLDTRKDGIERRRQGRISLKV